MTIVADLASLASGSLSNTVASRNQHGPYVRARTHPTGRLTVPIAAVRASLSFASQRWAVFLIERHRPGWNQYAKAQALTDRFGDRRHRTGREMYIRTNMIRHYFGLDPVDNAPVKHYLPEFGFPRVIGVHTLQRMSIHFDTTRSWVSQDGAALLIVSSPSTKTTVNFYKAPYRKAGKIDGSTSTPPVSPTIIDSPFPLATGDRVHLRIRVTMADGRLSTPKWIHGEILS